ncbi:SymE family type I addiction module toxin [Chryseobacterium vrystaatense]|uniref:SymE family type I addiction module toxin n=1 Tax=Chryseobacterium vrystaatense TaxID=307480 RepID=UPI0009FEBA89|nr:SymE family type I addiction module toxin [Chryseobacterium vrystaatense]
MMRKKISLRDKYKLFQNRNLTVSRKSFLRSYYRHALFPEIKIAGKWVQECGFEVGDKVAVMVSKNQIILRKMEVDGDSLA